MADTPRVAHETVGQESPEREERRRDRAGRGMTAWIATAGGVFAIVGLLFAIMLVAILVAMN